MKYNWFHLKFKKERIQVIFAHETRPRKLFLEILSESITTVGSEI